MSILAEWVFEEAEPSVGIFHDLILHDCGANVLDKEATAEVTRADTGNGLVTFTVTFTCPACGATTSTTHQEPASEVLP